MTDIAGLRRFHEYQVTDAGYRLESLPPAVICDVDGTVADMQKGIPGARSAFDWHRVGEDLPKQPIISLVKMLRREGNQIIFVSGRDNICHTATVAWLQQHGFPTAGLPGGDLLFMRDRRDTRPDVEVKAELFEQNICGRYDIRYVFDDRNAVVKLWRDLGFTTLQVADGNF